MLSGRKTLRERAVQLLKEMVETPSVSGSEVAVAGVIRRHMDELGYDTFIDKAGNLIGRIGTGMPHVLLCGHMDTVSGELPVTFDGDVLTGRGSVDAKGPLAALILGGASAVESGFSGSLIVTGAVEEEARNTGIQELIRHSYEVDFAIFGEPTNVDTLTLSYKGSVLIEVEIETPSGHSSAPWIYPNAIEKTMEMYGRIKETATSLTVEKEGFKALTTSIRGISGGKSHGVSPSHCKMWIELRVPPGINVDHLLEMVNSQTEGFNAQGTSVEMTVLDRVESYTADHKSSLVKAFTRSIYTHTGSRVLLVRKSGTGDMNYYGSATKVPCITYGPGDPHLDHTDHEHILIADYLRSIEIIKQALLNL